MREWYVNKPQIRGLSFTELKELKASLKEIQKEMEDDTEHHKDELQDVELKRQELPSSG